MIQENFPLLVAGDVAENEERLLADFQDGPFMQSENSVRYIIIHCSATRSNQEYTVQQMLRDHLARGFRTIGYHFYVRKNGCITQHRPLLAVGAHCRPFNRCSIGICYEGGLDENGKPADTRTEVQSLQLGLLLKKLLVLFPGAVIRGHRDMPGILPKSCPCFDAQAVFGHLENL